MRLPGPEWKEGWDRGYDSCSYQLQTVLLQGPYLEPDFCDNRLACFEHQRRIGCKGITGDIRKGTELLKKGLEAKLSPGQKCCWYPSFLC